MICYFLFFFVFVCFVASNPRLIDITALQVGSSKELSLCKWPAASELDQVRNSFCASGLE